RARPAGTHAANCPGRSARDDQGLCGPGSGKNLRPGAGTLSTDRGSCAPLLSAVGIVDVLFGAGGVTDGAGTGGAGPDPCPADTRLYALCPGPPCAGVNPVLPRTVYSCPRPPRAGPGPL